MNAQIDDSARLPVREHVLVSSAPADRPETFVREALEADLGALQAIEDAADVLLTDLLRPDAWQPAPTGTTRDGVPGFILIASADPGKAPVGFAQVVEAHGHAHPEQLSVLPEHGRTGRGRALVDAVKRTAAARGHDRLTLRTYADVPWNAPFYRTAGFFESEPDSAFLTDLAAAESSLGLDRYGRRVQMTAVLRADRAATPR